MNKFDPTLEEKFMALLIYMLFKRTEGLDAFCIADRLGMNLINESIFYESVDPDEPLKTWIRLGGKVNFSWFENHGPLDWMIMGQGPFEVLRNKDQILYTEMKAVRDKANKRWSNDWKQIKPKILTAKSIINIKPNQDSLDLTWRAIMSFCARRLQQSNMPLEAKKIQELSSKVSF
jgi:hypothetical protein